jgi:hypothetical protein
VAQLFSLGGIKHQTTMKTKFVVYLIVGLVIIDWIIAFVSLTIGDYLGEAIIFVSSVWAAFDSSKMQLKRYKSGISYGPVVIFIGCMLLWIVAMPWYLWMRHKIESSKAVLKDEVTNVAA